MKKLLLFTVILATVSIMAVGADAKAADTSNAVATSSQYQLRQIFRPRRPRWGNRNNRNVTVRYETRIVRKGNKVYRDTYRITWKNGREHVKRVDRVRIR